MGPAPLKLVLGNAVYAAGIPVNTDNHPVVEFCTSPIPPYDRGGSVLSQLCRTPVFPSMIRHLESAGRE